MRILFCGDVVGRSGREVITHYIPILSEKLYLDFVIVNGENAASGFGITEKICQEFYRSGVQAITTGNHIWDQKETIKFIERDPRLLRPLNFPSKTPGRGFNIFQTSKGGKILIINVMGRLFMESLDDPFAAIEQAIQGHILGTTVQAIIVDFHAEATSEKMAMGHFLDGRVSLVVGTHTHVPTADYQILPKRTAYQTDVGMCGDYNSVIGMEKTIPIDRFVRKLPTERMAPAEGPATLCGVCVDIDDKTGLALSIKPVRLNGILDQICPDLDKT
ncbi:MAG: TIGR00282 family metallophosphoesterase [Alphaproteobacteria bacterium]|nr:TIGR00282 family metallophosphoesterase [Alphaproteobacteria bacterium]